MVVDDNSACSSVRGYEYQGKQFIARMEREGVEITTTEDVFKSYSQHRAIVADDFNTEPGSPTNAATPRDIDLKLGDTSSLIRDVQGSSPLGHSGIGFPSLEGTKIGKKLVKKDQIRKE